MSLHSLICDPMDYFRPSLLLHQDLDGDDLLTHCLPDLPRRHRRMLLTAPYTKNWRSQLAKRDKQSNLAAKDKYEVNVDVHQFTPEEITVKASGDTITVEGKHEEKEDEHGFISRHFVRKYKVPEGHDMDSVKSKLSSDGVLTITAPKVKEGKEGEREIQIFLTGKPSQASIENASGKTEENKDVKKK